LYDIAYHFCPICPICPICPVDFVLRFIFVKIRKQEIMNKNILTIGQAAEYCALSPRTLGRYIKSGALKASRTPGGHYRIHKNALQSFIFEKGMYPLADHHSTVKIKILIVDDDSGIQKLLTKLFLKRGYETETAVNGFEAGAKVFKFKPDLIILDLIMPSMSGFDVCRQIKENPETAHIRILVITGYDTDENRTEIRKAGADGYLTKPLEMRRVMKLVKELLKNDITVESISDRKV